MGRKLYVGNLPYSIGEAELQELFAKAGSVETVRVMRDMATGRARGFAFVEMATDEEAQKAVTEFNEYELGGRALDGQRGTAEAGTLRRRRWFRRRARLGRRRWPWRRWWIARPRTTLVSPVYRTADS